MPETCQQHGSRIVMTGFHDYCRKDELDKECIAPRGLADGTAGVACRTTQSEQVVVIGQSEFEHLHRTIFGHEPHPVFAVLDGAIIDDLPARLQASAPEAMCLFSGNLDPMLAAAAPYLLPLRKGSASARIALQDGWNAHWGIVLVTEPGTSLHTLRAHLRRNLRVEVPGGQSLLFRFYDPRAFLAVVPTFDAEQRAAFFGPILGCYVESRNPDCAMYFSRDGDLAPRQLPLSAAA